MRKATKLIGSLLAGLLVLGVGCARTANRAGAVPTGRIIFQFTVQGKLALNREDVTYYIILNAPDGQPKVTLDPATQGPRVNGTSLNDPPTSLLGRLPFIGLLPGDVTSVWTDFYFLQGSADGRGAVGRGILRPDGTPEIVQRNYAVALWKTISESTVEIQMLYKDIFVDPDEDALPNNITVNLATSDSIDTGQGFLFDRWLSNVPFSIETPARNTPVRYEDTSTQLMMRPIPGKVIPTLPVGVNPADVNIISYEYKVLEL